MAKFEATDAVNNQPVVRRRRVRSAENIVGVNKRVEEKPSELRTRIQSFANFNMANFGLGFGTAFLQDTTDPCVQSP